MIDIADEIAYNNHDIDDGVGSGLLDPSFLAEHVPLWGDQYRAALRGETADARGGVCVGDAEEDRLPGAARRGVRGRPRGGRRKPLAR